MGRSAEKAEIAPYTTFGLGGKALAIVPVKMGVELVSTIKTAKDRKIKYELIAGGSNVVASDKFFNGWVIVFRDPRGKVKVNGATLECEASLPLANLIKTAVKNGLAGLESLSGIPGTVGGAVVGNAGAYGQNISNHLEAVEIWDGKKTRWIKKDDCHFGYRESIFKHRPWLVLRAKFKLAKGDPVALAKKSRELIKTRHKKYPTDLRCPGSFFKNVLVKSLTRGTLDKIDQAKIIEGKIPAGYLLESVGARGMKVGGIAVADYHGNLILNTGKGTFKEVRQLAAKLKQKVFRKFGIKLEEEVRYL